MEILYFKSGDVMDYAGKDKEAEIQNEIARLYVECRDKMLIFVNATVRNRMVADDIVQDVFLEALKKYSFFKVHPNQIGWLYRTARYKVREYERKLAEEHTIGIEEDGLIAGKKESGYQETEFKMMLNAALTSEERMRYFRYFCWGYSVEEMAAFEGVSVNNMRVRLSRLRKKLLQQVDNGEKRY